MSASPNQTKQMLAMMEKMSLQIAQLEKDNLSLQEQVKTKKTKKTKAPKVAKPLSATQHDTKQAMKQGILQAFREGGCHCRVWGSQNSGMGSQCRCSATNGNYCKSHAKKIAESPDGKWTCGDYLGERPEVWGQGRVPKKEKDGVKMSWMMERAVWEVAHAKMVKEAMKSSADSDDDDKTQAFQSEGSGEEIANLNDFVEEEVQQEISPPMTPPEDVAEVVAKEFVSKLLTNAINTAMAVEVKSPLTQELEDSAPVFEDDIPLSSDEEEVDMDDFANMADECGY
jgi:hypothetical protein